MEKTHLCIDCIGALANFKIYNPPLKVTCSRCQKMFNAQYKHSVGTIDISETCCLQCALASMQCQLCYKSTEMPIGISLEPIRINYREATPPPVNAPKKREVKSRGFFSCCMAPLNDSDESLAKSNELKFPPADEAEEAAKVEEAIEAVDACKVEEAVDAVDACKLDDAVAASKFDDAVATVDAAKVEEAEDISKVEAVEDISKVEEAEEASKIEAAVDASKVDEAISLVEAVKLEDDLQKIAEENALSASKSSSTKDEPTPQKKGGNANKKKNKK